ncbi:flagellar hook-length control protein FliK [Pseudochelatococcus sp. G4_1912]|uniref:flagellar hook-length control protein FliK n=1 Tax=Pseudochelatococcus sp. G4_1912 TaxID=3114288 RepID=UPI0039C609B8
MSAIDVASAANSPQHAAGKSKSGADKADDGAFDRVFESVGQKPSGNKHAPEKIERSAPKKDSVEKNASATDEDMPLPATPDTPVSETPDLSADLVRLLGGSANIAAMATSNEKAAADQQSSTALRRDALPRLTKDDNVENNPKSDPKTARLTIIGRETHFAPVGLPQHEKAPAQTNEAALKPIASVLAFKERPTNATDKSDTAPRNGPDKNMPIVDSKPNTSSRPGALEASLNSSVATRALAADTRNNTPSSSIAAKSSTVAVAADSTAPIATTGVLTQVVDQLISHARDLTTATGQSASTHGPASQPAEHSGGPVRILRLQLQPEELGLVTARLRIVGGVLELRLTADRQQSVEILQRDQEGLLEVLRRSGYKAEIASIDFARPNAGQQMTGQQQTGNGASQSFAQGSNSGTGGFGGDSGRPASEGHAKHQEPAERRFADERSVEGQSDGSGRPTRDPQAVYL